MSSRNKKIIGVIVAVVVLLLLLVVVWLSSLQTQESINIVNTQTNTTTGGGALNTSFGAAANRSVLDATGPVAPTPTPEKPDVGANLKRLAASFAERYGSFSNQGDFENLKELRVFMTDSMVREVDAYIAEAGSREAAVPDYVGMTTRALNSTVESFNESAGTATVRVNTQRQEVKSSGTRVFYQELVLKFISSGEIWEVDSADWEEE